MGPFVMAWLVAEGIVCYRSVKVQKAPPGPGQLLLSSGVFVALAILAESEKARPLATTLAWGFVAAAFMNLWGTGGPKADDKQTAKWPPSIAPNTVTIPGTGGS
jgi:hypothetical protein